MITLEEFRNTRKVLDCAFGERNVYAIHWEADETPDGTWSTGVGEFGALEEAEEALYQMYCDEDSLLEGY